MLYEYVVLQQYEVKQNASVNEYEITLILQICHYYHEPSSVKAIRYYISHFFKLPIFIKAKLFLQIDFFCIMPANFTLNAMSNCSHERVKTNKY